MPGCRQPGLGETRVLGGSSWGQEERTQSKCWEALMPEDRRFIQRASLETWRADPGAEGTPEPRVE